MFMQAPKSDVEPAQAGTFEVTVLIACAAMILLLGVVPQNLFVILGDIDVLQLAQNAAQSLATTR